ncbi:hypothetical protein ACOSP7_018495 [Xanthoceras sorbifolium]
MGTETPINESSRGIDADFENAAKSGGSRFDILGDDVEYAIEGNKNQCDNNQKSALADITNKKAKGPDIPKKAFIDAEGRIKKGLSIDKKKFDSFRSRTNEPDREEV